MSTHVYADLLVRLKEEAHILIIHNRYTFILGGFIRSQLDVCIHPCLIKLSATGRCCP